MWSSFCRTRGRYVCRGSRPIRALGLVVALLPAWLAGQAPQQQYYAGGTVPFTPDQKAILDRHAPVLSLGINRDWLTAAQVDIDVYLQGISTVALAVEENRIPGAVVLANRLGEEVYPVAVGHQITDPQKRPAAVDTFYDVGSLTGPLLVTPQIMAALYEGILRLDEPVHQILPWLSNTGHEAITVEMLLRHSSGLSPDYGSAMAAVRTREESLAAIAALPLVSTPGTEVHVSNLNWFLLARILEVKREQSFAKLATEKVLDAMQTQVATLDLPTDRLGSLAPGHYSRELGYMVWGDAVDPLARLWGTDCGFWGLKTIALDAEAMLRLSLTLARLSLPREGQDVAPENLPALARAITSAPGVRGGEQMGLGFMVGKYGYGSFGWDAAEGSSFWVLTRENAMLIYLSNPTHPNGIPEDFVDPRDLALRLLARSLALKEGAAGVDIRPVAPDALQPSPTPAEPKP